MLTNCTNDGTTTDTGTATSTLEAVYLNYPQADVLSKYLKPYPDQISSAVPPNSVELKAAMDAYNAGEYQAAIDTFPNFSRKPDQVSYIHLYKGISFLMTGQEHDAFNTFQFIRSNNQEAFEVSEWYRALCYVAYNNIYEARRKLETIVANETYAKEEAAELLEVLPVK
ncbi:MAG: hypothetical protein AAGJ93_05230 [Bacteroidota bacterium]